jgi:hypothetical protein
MAPAEDKVHNEGCIGCLMFDGIFDCNYKSDDKFDERFCPCKDCLIKMMCEEACDKYHAITDFGRG